MLIIISLNLTGSYAHGSDDEFAGVVLLFDYFQPVDDDGRHGRFRVGQREQLFVEHDGRFFDELVVLVRGSRPVARHVLNGHRGKCRPIPDPSHQQQEQMASGR